MNYLKQNMRGLWRLDTWPREKLEHMAAYLERTLPLANNPLNARDSEALLAAIRDCLTER